MLCLCFSHNQAEKGSVLLIVLSLSALMSLLVLSFSEAVYWSEQAVQLRYSALQKQQQYRVQQHSQFQLIQQCALNQASFCHGLWLKKLGEYHNIGYYSVYSKSSAPQVYAISALKTKKHD